MNVLGIDFTFFAVSDRQKSLTFYRDLLGIPLACLVYEGTWAEFEINPGTLVLGQGHGFTQPGGGMVALAVEDAKANEVEPLIQYAKDFFTLQIRFVQKIAEVSHQALEDVLIDYTMLRNLFNLRVSHDLSNPLWNTFIKGLSTSDNPEDWTYDFYLQRIGVESDASDERQFFGCFSYVYPWRNTHKLRLHFENRDTSEYGALSKDRMPARKSELSAMFRHIQANHPDVETVRGGSWLYNIPAYLRLFPPDYIKTAKPVGYETSFWALWGQFVARKGSIRQPAASQFLDCLNKQKTVDGCLQCFPYQVLRPECSIETFYDFYNL